MAVYFATKAFVLSLTEALHEELKPHGVQVTCLCPGPTRTEFGDVAGFGGNGLFDRVGDGIARASSRPGSTGSTGTRQSSSPASSTRSAQRARASRRVRSFAKSRERSNIERGY